MDDVKRKLERAIAKGDTERIARLQERLVILRTGTKETIMPLSLDSEFEVNTSHIEDRLRRKLAKAVERGDMDKQAKIREELFVMANGARKLERKLEKAVGRGNDAKAARVRGELDALRAGFLAAESLASVQPEPRTEDMHVDLDVAKVERKVQKAVARGDSEKASKLRTMLNTLQSRNEAAMADDEDGGVARSTVRSKRQREGDNATSEQKQPRTASNDAPMAIGTEPRTYPPQKPGNVSILLFYAYVKPHWTRAEQNAAISFIDSTLSTNGVTGRVRVAVEGLNATLSGTAAGVKAFCTALQAYQPKDFKDIDFKVVHGLQDNKAFKGLKVWPVDELVTYGFDSTEASLENGGLHVKPEVFTEMASDPDAVLIDVRNANETAIGRFIPPLGGAQPLDPRMRRSTEFLGWVDANLDMLRSKKTILMCCTAGIRCERASALIRQKLSGSSSMASASSSSAAPTVVQLEGGIHRYLDAYPEDGGMWKGKNYTFDKRFSHGAGKAEVVSSCCVCSCPWDRYQAQLKCSVCRMEVLVCKECQRSGKADKAMRLCWLCDETDKAKKAGGAAARTAAAAQAAAAAFARTGGGRDGEGEGKSVVADDSWETGAGNGRGGRGGLGSGQGAYNGQRPGPFETGSRGWRK